MDNLSRIINTESSSLTCQHNGVRRSYFLTDDEKEYIREKYPYMNTAMLAEELGIARANVTRQAKKMGLTKDAGYMHLMNQEKGRAARAIQIEIQKTKSRKWESQFRRGYSVRQDMSEEQILAYNKKISEAKKELYRKERRRVEFGLPQRSNIRVGRQNPYKLKLKYRLKAKGYVIDEEKGIAYYNENTTRATTCEKRGNPWFTFKPINEKD